MLLSSGGFTLLSILGSLLLLSSLVHVNAEPKVVSMKTNRIRHNSLPKRGTNEVPLLSGLGGALYLVNTTVGTPGQNVTFLVDTGSDITWMLGPGVQSEFPTDHLNFDPNQSNTFASLGDGFVITYVDGTSASGQFFADTFAIGDFEVPNAMLALGTETNGSDIGVMGLGPVWDNERVNNGTEPYKNILDVMADHGLINSRCSSLWLDSLDSEEGNILFGGYDTEKFYDDQLNMLDMQPPQNMYVVLVTGIVLEYDGRQYGMPMENPLPVLLDSGSTVSSLPSAIVEPLAAYLHASPLGDDYIVPCSWKNRTDNLWFQLGSIDGPWVAVPFSELAIPAGTMDGETICFFGMTSRKGDVSGFVLGDTFLRSAYVFYDLENKQIGIANAKWNVEESNIIEVSSASAAKSATSDAGATYTYTTPRPLMKPGKHVLSGNFSGVATATGSVTSLEGGVTTSINGTIAISRHTGTDTPTPTGAETSSPASSTTSASAASGAAAFEQPVLSTLLLPFCGSIMLVAALIIV